MKKQTIFIGAVLVAVIATAFAYIPRTHESPQTISISSATTTTQAILKVGEKSYTVDISSGETVIRAMRALVDASGFAYTSREYPGLGEFVDSINGIKNSGGMYWILYVNGITASLGASAIVLKADDVIEWKYEKSF